MHAASKAILNWRTEPVPPARSALATLAALTCWLALAGTAGAAPRITPSGPGVPENLLRIEVQLDAPLAAPLDMRRVVLRDSAGAVRSDALLDLALPSQDGMSVSLLLHPGRIKSGVGPNLALGPALHPGETVTLTISDPQLGAPLHTSWSVEAAVRDAIEPRRWTVHPVTVGGRTALRIDFPGALDGLAAGLIAVQAPDGRRLAGQAVLAPGERSWRFTPLLPWRAGRYLLRIHPSLEDPQGNRLCSAFEQAEQSKQACQQEGRLEFDPSPSSVR